MPIKAQSDSDFESFLILDCGIQRVGPVFSDRLFRSAKVVIEQDYPWACRQLRGCLFVRAGRWSRRHACYRRIAEHDLLGGSRYYEEQLALAIAVAKTRVPYEVDNHRLDGSFFHYYTLKRLRSHTAHATFVCELASEFDGLADVLLGHSDWNSLLQAGNANPHSPRH